MSEPNKTIFVAEMENKLVGFLAVIGGDVKRNRHSANVVLGVLEDYQGQGIATKLFHEAFEWAKEVGISRLGLTVMKGNDKAFNLYRKMGFVLEGERIQSLRVNGEFVDEYYMYKLL
ncbi:GNAT family N-acetyltransferase [Geobacillus subterraneus]|uniref:GNAT family N-acetyltransferase n=1 Tax=Geobacillus subterraneus TaxID=129338 RepID=UPI00180F64E7